MTSGLVIHIAAGDETHTEVLTSERIRIGAGQDCDLRITATSPALAHPSNESGIWLELARSNGSYRVKDKDRALEITRNGVPLVIDSKIADGDEVLIGDSNLALKFFPLNALPAVINQRHEKHVAPFIEHAAIESAATARRDDAKIFLREFTRELVREIKPSTKIITLAIALALVGGVLYIGFALYKEVQSSRRLIDEQKVELARMRDEVTGTRREVRQVDESNKIIRDSLSLAPKLRSDYGAGVCLISGTYYFQETGTNRPLRFPETRNEEDTNGVTDSQNSTTLPPPLTPEGRGAIAEFEFVGTGFYVGNGFVLTNRHVAQQPWIADERAMSLSSSVNGQPRMKKIVAYFPNRRQPIALKFKQAARNDDVAVCLLDVKDFPPEIPMLPLDRDSDAAEVGKAVTMMGYPTGPDRLLALLDDAEARSVQERYGSSFETLLDYLSDTNHIQPLTTQGHITDLDERRIVYDARTAEGGSGAPLFGQSGRVIGVNFAVFTENSASNFAVPVRYAVTLLQRAGWTPPESPNDEQSDGANTNQTNSRSAASASNGSR